MYRPSIPPAYWIINPVPARPSNRYKRFDFRSRSWVESPAVNQKIWSRGPGIDCWRCGVLIFAAGGLLLLSACQTGNFSSLDEQKLIQADPIVLREGDTVRVSFPGAPNLNAGQIIKRDGRISMQMVGEVQAAGLTVKQLEDELLKLYGPQLQTKEVSVAVDASNFPVYVTGAVVRPGKIMPDRPMTALEAVMEAGGFDFTKANQSGVTVIRHENGRVDHIKVNLKKALQGNETEPFNLKPGDIVYVPERFAWF
jgi:polysaccharide export outer membrane protein